MANSSIFVTANEARQNSIRETIVHDEVRGIETVVLNSVRNGLYQATVTSGTPMTSRGLTNITVQSIDLATNQLFVPNHPFKMGDLVTVSSTEILPSPLISTKYYSVIYIDSNYIKLAATVSDALELRPLSIDFSIGVTDIVLTNPGAGYVEAPYVKIEEPPVGTPATAIANLAYYGSISSIKLFSHGSGYTDLPSVVMNTIGSGAVVNVVEFSAVAISIASGGADYRVGDILTVTGGTGTSTTATVTSVNSNGSVATIILSRPGLYTALPNLSNASTTVIPHGGSGCTLNLIMGIGGLKIDTILPGGSSGSGYADPPVVIISGGDGIGAEAEAIISAGKVIRFNMLHLGSGYTSNPTISLSTGFGTIASAEIIPVPVGNLQLTNNGGNTYTSIPTVELNSIGRYASIGAITMKIVSAQLVQGGSGYFVGETVLVAGGEGSANAAILVTKVGGLGDIINYSLVTSGTYSVLPSLDNNLVTDGSGQSAAFRLTAGVNTIAVDYSGIEYDTAPYVKITPSNGYGSGATARAILYVDEVSDIEVITAGSGYTAIPIITITNGSGATAVANLTPTSVYAINVLQGGIGYSANATSLEIVGTGTGVEYTIDFEQGGSISYINIYSHGSGFTDVPVVNVIGDGNGAILEAELQPTTIQSLTLTNSGIDYVKPPMVVIEGAAIAVARLVPTTISRINVISPGTNWTTVPTVYVVPGALQTGTPIAPSAVATIGYSIKNISIINQGSGYDTPPAITIAPPGGNGTPATAISYIGSGTGTMVVSGYPDSKDYYKVWKNQTPSNTAFVRPYAERMDTVINYFTALGYTITRQTNPATGNTIQWQIMW